MTTPPDNSPQTSHAVDWQRLPAVKSPLTPTEALDRLGTASKRGRLPGFERLPAELFSLDLFGVPWDRILVGTVTADTTGSTIRFTKRDKRTMPYSWAAALVLSVWPGVVLTDALIPSSWGWIGTHVYEWYLPLTIISNIWTWIWAVRKTDATTKASAVEAIAAVATEVSGSVET
jgi:hypothetical protein